MRLILAVTFLLAQVAMLVYARFEPSAHFHWAPFDIQCEYWISVELDGRSLTGTEIRERYNKRATAVDPHAIEHVLAVVRRYEETYGREDEASVLVRYRINGREMQEWLWPKQ